ncbi:hypothetical protein [Erythrobacter alti]|uniref:hypothetical protein n=1 Tax=Erythrobacter alti TaxID=1896145 RepID=UPI0030F42927
MASTAKAVDLVPREPREPCSVETTIVDDCGRELEAWVGNTSRHGFMAECEEKFPLGEIIRIDLPDRGRVRAQLRWAVGWRFGALILID